MLILFAYQVMLMIKIMEDIYVKAIERGMTLREEQVVYNMKDEPLHSEPDSNSKC